MKLPCYIVKDLLELRHDGVVSEESAKDIDAHLEGCAACRAEYERLIGSDCVAERVYDEEEERRIAESYRQVRRENRRKLIRASVLSALLAGLLFAVVFMGIKIYNTRPVRPMPVKNVQTVEELRAELEKDGLDQLIPDPALLHTKSNYECAISLTDRTRRAKAVSYWINGRSSEQDYFWTVETAPSPNGWVREGEEYKGTVIGREEVWGDPPEDEPDAGRSYSVGLRFVMDGVSYVVRGTFQTFSMSTEEISAKRDMMREDLMNTAKAMIDSAD